MKDKKSERRHSTKEMANLAAGDKFQRVMKEYGNGTLHSSSGELVTDASQARAIAMSEQERANKGE